MALGPFIMVGITEKPQTIFSKDAFLEAPKFGTMTGTCNDFILY
jgi:hypothetical protein